MTNAPQQPPAAGWYPDPAGTDAERFWDGTGWSQSTRDRAPQQAFTPAAGQQWDGMPQGGYGNPMGGHQAGGYQPLQPVARVAGFWIRLVGYILDSLVLWLPTSLLSMLLGISATLNGEMERWMREVLIWEDGGAVGDLPMLSDAFMSALLWSAVLSLVVYALYRVLMLGKFNATVGQLVLGLRTVPVGAGEPTNIGWQAATIRGIGGAVLYGLPLIQIINGLFAAFPPAKQTLSDKLSKTQVLKVR